MLSLALLTVDHLSGLLDEVRAALTFVVTPIVYVADLPSQGAREVTNAVQSRDDMSARIAVLEQELLLLRARTERWRR